MTGSAEARIHRGIEQYRGTAIARKFIVLPRVALAVPGGLDFLFEREAS